jgi:hypothetical protein
MSEAPRKIDSVSLSPLKQALLAKRLKAKAAASAPAPAGLARRPDPRLAPLSFSQEQLWRLRESEGRLTYYAQAFRIAGPLDTDALARAVGEIVRRHETLRTTFETVSGQVMQVVRPPDAAPALARVAPEGDGAAPGEEELRRLLGAEAERPFDPGSEALFRATLFRLGEEDHALLVVLPHLICDRWSLNLLTRELLLLYQAFSRGQPSPLPEPALQYGDYAYWERREWGGAVEHESVAFWRGQLAGAPPAMKLPADFAPGAGARTGRCGRESVTLGRGHADALRALAAGADATLFMSCLAGFKALLHRSTGECDILVGSGVAGRVRPEFDAVVGCFNKFLFYRTAVSPEMTFSRLLRGVRELALQVYTHQDVPPVKALDESHAGQGWLSPRSNVSFAVQHPARQSAGQAGGVRLDTIRLDSQWSKNELGARVNAVGDELLLTFEYDADLFSPGTVARLLGQYGELLGAVAARPELRLADLPGRG